VPFRSVFKSHWILPLSFFRILFQSSVAILILFPFTDTALSDIYRWIDDTGVVHYSNDPPPEDAEKIQKYPELSSEDRNIETEAAAYEKEPDTAASTATPSEMGDAASGAQTPPDSETMTRLKKNLKTRTSSHQQRKFQRRIKARQIEEGIAPNPDTGNP